MSIVTLGHTKPVARTEHECMWCYRVIERGERYENQRNLLDGRVYTWKNCLHCSAMANLCSLYDLGYDEGIGADTFCDFDPDSIFEARCKVMWRRKWRRKDGTLYDIPKAA